MELIKMFVNENNLQTIGTREDRGIEIVGENQWIILIQNASHHSTVNSNSDHSKT